MGTNPNKLKRSLLATSIAAACTISSVGVNAQVADEEVVVRGIRASMQAAMDIKRNSTGVVDAISSEDIGKMPDANLAESLQRITGVSITRTNGEGARVTIRGIDPALNMVTLNGRNMPAVTNDGTTGNKSSRAFDFAGLASEAVTGVEVYKTGKATVSGGGLGGTINLKTIKPLDAGDQRSVGIKAVQDETTFRSQAGEEFTPELFGLYSWANDDSTFGVALTGAYQERDNTRSQAFVNNWQRKVWGTDALPAGAAVTNAPDDGQVYAVPTDLRYSVEDNHRERTNAQLTLQYRPVENLTATVDYTYSEYELSADRSQQSTWYNVSAIDAVTFDTGSEVATPVIYSETYAGGKDVSFAQQKYVSSSENESLGVNLAWEVTDALELTLDYHSSSATNRTDQTELGLNANVVTGNYSDWRADLPVMGITFDDSDPTKGNDNGVLDGGDVSGAMGSVSYDNQEVKIDQLQIKGAFDLGGFLFFEQSGIDFGIDTHTDIASNVENNGTSPRITMGNWGGVDPDAFGANWPSYFTIRDFGDAFPDHDGATGDSNFLSYGLDGDIDAIIGAIEATHALANTRIRINADDPTTVDDPSTPDTVENVESYYYVTALDANGDHYLNRTNDATPDNFNSFVDGKIQANRNLTGSRKVEEEVMAFYVQFHGAFNIGSMESNIVVGLRQEETDVISSAVVVLPESQSWDDNNDFSFIAGSGLATTYEEVHSYSNFLPNVDLDISLTDALKLRASYSETMGRTSYDNLKPDYAFGSQYLKQATSGNPQLDAMESTNIDLSFEFYYGDSSMVSLGVFTKDVTNFVGSTVVQSEIYGLLDPRSGEYYDQALAEIGDVNEETAIFERVIELDGQDPTVESTSYVPDASRDDVQIWDVSQPGNNRDDSLEGIELALTHWFGDSGFGVQANYTMVDSDLEVDLSSDAEQFAMVGVSDTANFVAMYDNNGLQARIAYNWRDSYLRTTVEGGNNAPGFVAAYSQLDLSVSYDISDNVTLSAEALNVTGEDSRRYGRSERQMFQLEDLGARYQVGARYTF